MKPNPYEPPESAPADEATGEHSQRIVRRGVPLAIAVAWNTPLAAMMLLAVTGAISPDAMVRAMAAWSLSIPAFSVALLLVPSLQSLIFMPHVEMATMRPRLWGLAALWLAIFGVWLFTELVRSG